MTYDEINAIGANLQSYMGVESIMIVAIGSRKGSPGCESGSVSVTVTKGLFTTTSEALRLGDAAVMARAKVNRMIEADAKAKAEAKKAAA